MLFLLLFILIFLGNLVLLKSKKVVLPGVDWKNLKAVSFVLNPLYFVVPIFFIFLIAQLVEDLV